MKTIYKHLIMVLAAICAIACFVIAVKNDEILIAIITLCSSFIPIIVWFVDSKESESNTKKLKEEIANLKDQLTWKEL